MFYMAFICPSVCLVCRLLETLRKKKTTNGIFMKILSLTCLWTRKFTLNCASHPDRVQYSCSVIVCCVMPVTVFFYSNYKLYTIRIGLYRVGQLK